MDASNEESPPLIVKETTKIVESNAMDEEKIKESEQLLERKMRYYEDLKEYENKLNRTIAEETAALHSSNSRRKILEEKTEYLLNKGRSICNTCNSAYEELDKLEPILDKCEKEFDEIDQVLSKKNLQYKKKADELAKTVSSLKQNRQKLQESFKAETEDLIRTNIKLKSQLEFIQSGMLNDEIDNDDEELETLKNELQGYKDTLLKLNEENSQIEQLYKESEVAREKIEKEYMEIIFPDIEKKNHQLDAEIAKLTQNLEMHKLDEEKSIKSVQNLKICENKVNTEMAEITEIYNLKEAQLLQLRKKIVEIQAQISELSTDDEITKTLEKNTAIFNKNVVEIEEANTAINQLQENLNEIDASLDLLKQTDCNTRLCNEKSAMDGLLKEQDTIQKSIADKENELKILTKQLEKDRDKGELEAIAEENRLLIELKELEKQARAQKTAHAELNEQMRASDDNLNDLEATIQKLKAAEAALEKTNREMDKIIEAYEEEKRKAKYSKLEAARKNAQSAPPPIYLKKGHLPRNNSGEINRTAKKVFKMPGDPAANRQLDTDISMEVTNVKISRKPAAKKQSPPSAALLDKRGNPVSSQGSTSIKNSQTKRNWDSDSSMEGEGLKLTDILKRRNRGRSREPKK